MAFNLLNIHPVPGTMLTILLKKYFSIYFWLYWVFVAAHGLSLVQCAILLQWFLLLWSMGSRRTGFSSCSMWA